ncbi:MAG: hypothetical protein WCS99_05040 [Limisphaerales bacterium]
MSTVTNALPLPPLYYLPNDGSYWKADSSGKWIKINEGSAMLEIRAAGFDAKSPADLSEADRCRLDLQTRQNVTYAAPLAGYRAGHYRINESDVLVTESPRPIVPRAGEWPTLRLLFERMFADSTCDQLPYFYGWLKRGIEATRSGHWMPGQALAMAGPINSAKSLTQELITGLLGGRSAKPYLYLTGDTTFNGDLFRAEHLMVEDEAESKDFRARRHFAAGIKGIAVNRNHYCHGKHKQALTLTPIWRLTISLNDDPERLLVLPPLDDDVADKVILLKTQACAMPMPTATPEELEAFKQRLTGELPAFAAFLGAWEIPERLRSPRFGITHFHHPDLVEVLKKAAPEHRLLDLIDLGLDFREHAGLNQHGVDCRAWEGTALELERRLTQEGSPVAREAAKLLSYQTTCGTLLGRLERTPRLDRVASRVVTGQTRWTVRPPANACAPRHRAETRAGDEGEPPRPPAGLALAA